jgi:hypothetical protein
VNLSLPVIQAVSVALIVLGFVVLPLGLMFWLGRKAEPAMPPARSVSGVAGRLVFVGVLFGIYIVYLNTGIMRWPPRTLERMENRARTVEKVELAGGWSAVTGGCNELMKQPQFYNYHWQMGRCLPPPGLPAIDLPPALAALKPAVVSLARHSETEWAVNLKLRVGRGNNYGLRVMCSVPTNSLSTLPRFTSPPIFRSGRQLADRVYEF